MLSGRAQRLHGQEIAEQRAICKVDRKDAAQDIGAPAEIVASEHFACAGISARGDRLSRDLGNIGGISQSHVESLRADRRDDMSGFADQRHALARELPRPLDRQRKLMTPSLDSHAAQD